MSMMVATASTTEATGLCACGCGRPSRPGNQFIKGHQRSWKHTMDGPNPSGLCFCGCGQQVPLSKRTNVAKGLVEGKPATYIKGHARSGQHYLLEVDTEARTGICVLCGPVSVRKNGTRAGRGGPWICHSTDRQRAEKNRRLIRDYGITLIDYMQMLVEQDNHCAICPTEHTWENPLRVDHNHETGVVAGLLCDLCNTGIGSLQEDPVILMAAVAYVTKKGTLS